MSMLIVIVLWNTYYPRNTPHSSVFAVVCRLCICQSHAGIASK